MKYLKINISTYLQFIIIFFFLLIHNSNNCFSQTTNELGFPFIRNYTPKEYNGSSQNWAIAQDKRGVLYFGNTTSIVEYDGKNWKTYEASNKSVIRSLATDSNGTVYVGGSGEFGFLASDSTGQLKYISLTNKLKETDKIFNDVWKTHATTHGIYFLTENKTFRFYNDTINLLPEKYSSHHGYVVNDKLYIFKRDSGIYVFKNNSFQLLPHSQELALNIGEIIILPYENSKILIATRNKGIYIYDLEMLSKNLSVSPDNHDENEKQSPLINLHTEIADYLKYNILYSGVKINNSYAFGTVTGGIIIIDDQGKLIQVINKNRGLQNNCILNLFLDKSNNLWAATNSGFSEIEISSPITRFNELNNVEDIVLSTIVYKGKRYIGTMKGIYRQPDYNLNIYNDINKFIHIKNFNSSCWELAIIKNNLFALGPNGITSICDTIAKELFDIGKIYCYCKSIKFPEHVFFGLSDGFVVSKFKYTNNKQANIKPDKTVKFYNTKRFDDINNSVRKIVSDSCGDLWLTTPYKGIIHVKFNNNDINDFQITRYDTANGLPENDRNYVHFSNNKLIIASSQGLYKITKSFVPETNDTIIKFVPDTLINNESIKNIGRVYKISVDSKNNFWLICDAGLGKIYKNKDGILKWDGISLKKIPLEQTYKQSIEENDILFYYSHEGLFRYDPNIYKNYNSQFHSLIRKVILGKDSIIFNGTYYNESSKKHDYYLFTSFTQPQQLIPTLNYMNNSVTFEYSTAFYEHETANSFKYFLEGFDKEWSNWTSETKKEYTNLHEGTYYFKVKAKNIFEVESTEAIYKFKILPPWHRTIFAYIVYGLILLFGFYIGIKLNSRRLTALNLRLENIIKKRTTEIQQQKEEILAQAEELEVTNKELEKLSIVASETDNAVVIIDANGKTEWINEGFTRMTGYTLDEIWAIKGHDFIKTSSNPNINKELNKCKEHKISVIYSTKNYTKDKREMWVQTTLTPILDKNDNIIKYIAIDTDITKIKLAEKEIEKQKNEIECQRDQIAEINMEVKDSILYASRIQSALLTPRELMNKYLSDYFIINKPRDIVSGDFYWVGQKDNKLIIAVADCTGHGVPGAFMSMLGMTYINEIVNIAKTRKGVSLQPNEILNQLREKIIKSLHQKEKEGETNDGMDISLCIIDYKKMELQFSGANNPAYLIRKNKLQEIAADKMPIGIYVNDNQPFTAQSIKLIKNDMLYLMSDGYSDQFGGNKGKKFMIWRLKEILQSNSNLHINEQKTHLINIHEKWKGKSEQVDDILIMGIKI
ncbi:MAG: SpoIIE family protein phosphatase [Bacteroidales bacterium]|nr:SpoIIE family protein phosphatase [Bacteroidales bacterium]